MLVGRALSHLSTYLRQYWDIWQYVFRIYSAWFQLAESTNWIRALCWSFLELTPTHTEQTTDKMN